jgi:hypothetical protein
MVSLNHILISKKELKKIQEDEEVHLKKDKLREIKKKVIPSKIYYVPSGKSWKEDKGTFFLIYEALEEKYGTGINHRFTKENFIFEFIYTGLYLPDISDSFLEHNPEYSSHEYCESAMIEKGLLKKLKEEDF